MISPFSSSRRGLAAVQRTLNIRRHSIRTGKAIDSSWDSFAGIIPISTAFAGVIPRIGGPQHVNLLLPGLSEGSIFAGIRTALVAADLLARHSGRQLRIISFGGYPDSAARRSVQRLLGRSFDELSFASGWSLDQVDINEQDFWIATYWTTAHALQAAASADILSPSKVVYLIQDYEPSFYAASTESALARATYHAGFHHLVNSAPLASVLDREEGHSAASSFVFRPELDLGEIKRAAALRARTERSLVGFYGRPSKPRNSFRLGVAALRVASRVLAGHSMEVNFVSVGEPHPPLPLPGGGTLRSLGKLAWSSYFDFVARSNVMFSLQQTPHPSHIPLDAVASGGFAVVNDVLSSRSGLSSRLHAKQGGPEQLGEAIAQAVLLSSEHHSTGYDQRFVERLGEPLAKKIEELAAEMSSLV